MQIVLRTSWFCSSYYHRALAPAEAVCAADEKSMSCILWDVLMQVPESLSIVLMVFILIRLRYVQQV